MIRVTSKGGQDQVQLFLAQIIKVRVIVEAEESLKNGSIRVLQIMGDQSLDLNLNPFLHKRERLPVWERELRVSSHAETSKEWQ